MSQYDFYVGLLRFISSEADRREPRVDAMMQCLDHIATCAEAGDTFTVTVDKRELASRALAGVAALLQKQVLPEVIAYHNTKGEIEIRWAVDASLASMGEILKAQAAQLDGPLTITLPPPPRYGD